MSKDGGAEEVNAVSQIADSIYLIVNLPQNRLSFMTKDELLYIDFILILGQKQWPEAIKRWESRGDISEWTTGK